MFAKLSRITQAISLAENQQQVLELTVNKVCNELNVEVCSIFIADHQKKQFVLMATQGLNLKRIGQLTVDFNQGLVGLVGRGEAPLNCANVKSHPSFHYDKEINEDDFSTYLGVPIIHQRNVLGVLSIQQRQNYQFELDEETFLITLAGQLASIISNQENELELTEELNPQFVRSLSGSPVSTGVAIGTSKVFFPSHDITNIPTQKTTNTSVEIKRLHKAVKRTHLQLEKMSNRMKGLITEQERSLFQAYQQILISAGIESEVEEQIYAGYTAPSALKIVIFRHLRAFQSMKDRYLQERAHDIEDLANRVLANMMKKDALIFEPEAGTILIAESLTVSMLAELPLQNIVAIISLQGSATSHAAILTKALGIPAIMGLEPCKINRLDNKVMIVDAYTGQLLISPDKASIEQYKILINQENALSKELENEQSRSNTTKDGTEISLFVNSSLGVDFQQAKKSGAQGIGLYRSEVPFMQHSHFPSEDTQVKIYKQLLDNIDGLPVTIRTLDIGGDKQLPYFEIKEENPFLGWRGVRVTLDHPEIFLVQLRAIIKASAGNNNLKIALPMIATLEELDHCNRLINQAYSEIQSELPNNIELHRPKIGIILEVPSTVFQLSSFIKRIDFISIGTNDLIQYLMAVDRNNVKLKSLYSHFQPAVLQILKQIYQQCQHSPISLQVCGEMASDPLAAILLVGLGFREFSMSAGNIVKVKRVLSRFTVTEMQQIVEQSMQYETEAKVRSELLKSMEQHGLGGLIRAGN